MSNDEFSREEIPRLEPWLVAGLSSLATLAGALLVPVPWSWYLLATAAALLIVSAGMLSAQERRRRKQRVRR
jgi:hypothetical protein